MENLKKFMSMRWMLMLVSAMLLSLSLAACGDDDDEEENLSGGTRPLAGYWLGTDRYGESVYQFNNDGSGFFQRLPNGRVDRFTDYMVKDNQLYILWVNDDEFDDEGEIRISGNSFQIRWDDDVDYWTTYTKQ